MALMNESGHQGVIGASGPIATRLENVQFELGEGPSLDASRANSPVSHPDLTASAVMPWPGFGPAALALGVRAVLALPLQVGAIQTGRALPVPLDARALGPRRDGHALAYAEAAVAVLLLLQAQTQPGPALHPELDEPLEYRAEVHQATGYLVRRRPRSALAEALLLLRAHAFASGRSLLDISRDVMAGRLRLHPEEGEDG